MNSPHIENILNQIAELNEAIRLTYEDGMTVFALRVEETINYEDRGLMQIRCGMIAEVR